MATRLFSDLVNRIAPSVPGCPQPVIVNYIRDAAIDACERTSAWRYKHATVTMVAGTYEYAFVPEAGAEVHTILTANINGSFLTPVTLEQMHEMYPASTPLVWPQSVRRHGISSRSAHSHCTWPWFRITALTPLRCS
jgi:hypothetical protein